MPETVVDLGRKAKSKYPGAYDDMTDIDLGRKIKAKYPDAYADFADVWEAQKEITPKSSAPGRFLTGLTDEMVNMLNPVNAYKTAKVMGEAALRGGRAGLESTITQGAQAQAQSIYDQAQGGDVAGALGRGTANVAPFGMSKALSLMKFRVPSYTTPAQEAAIGLAKRKGIGLDVAEVTQNPVAQGMKAQFSRLPFVAGSIAKRKLTVNQQMDAALSDIAGQTGPFTVVNPQMTGTRLTRALKSSFEKSKAEVKDAATTLETMAEDNPKKVQTGYRIEEVTTADPMAMMTGQIAAKQIKVPIIEELPAPVKLTGLSEKATELLQEFDNTIGQVQRDNMPAYMALKQIASRKAEYIPLMDALHELSSLKSGSRAAGWLRSKSQGKFTQLVGEMQKAVDDVISELGPDAEAAFKTYNEKTVLKHEAAKVGMKAEKMGGARYFDYLTSPSDYNVESLVDYLGKYPAAKDTIRNSWMNRTMNQMQEKGILSWRGAKVRWERLGQKTKDLLWDKQAQQDLSELFDVAQMVQANPNPSGTAIVSALGNLGSMILRNPLQSVGYILGSREIAKILSSPEGAALLKEGLRLPMTSSNAPIITSALLVSSGLGKVETPER